MSEALNLGEIRDYLLQTFAANAGLSGSFLSHDPTLAEVITESDKMHNSVDLIETLARTANTMERDRGIKVRLPAFSLDTRVSAVLDAILDEIKDQNVVTQN
jgi:hypothetical protein